MLHWIYQLVFTSATLGTLEAPEVRLGKTNVIGAKFEPANVEFFGGLPFAKPPLAELRLRSPVLETSLSPGTFHATNFGLACQQNISALPVSMVSEDCLTLNIFRPAGVDENAKLPVMVWIHGGGYTKGSGSIYNGTGIVAQSVKRGTPVIFASINYRIGPLGFPQGAEAGRQNIVNLGLQDQVVALEWIQANIGNFGGDKSKVTVFGESAGAASISIHILGAKIKKLARAAIIQSTVTLPTYGPERNEANWQQFVAGIPSCVSVANTSETLDCVRKADSASLLSALTNTGVGFFVIPDFQPVLDGPGGFLPDRPSKLVPQSYLPSMIGSNLDEGTLFASQSTNTTEEIRQYLTAAITPPIVSLEQQAETVDGILTLYPDVPALGSPFGTGNNTFGVSSQYKRLAAIFGDFIFQSPRRSFTQGMSAAGVKVFSYYFTDPNATIPPTLSPGNLPPAESLGISHTYEIPYVFGTLGDPAAKIPSSEHLSLIMQDYWISFAVNLDPNDGHGNERPYWEPYTPANQVLMELNGQNTRLVPDNFREKQIAFLQDNPDALHR